MSAVKKQIKVRALGVNGVEKKKTGKTTSKPSNKKLSRTPIRKSAKKITEKITRKIAVKQSDIKAKGGSGVEKKDKGGKQKVNIDARRIDGLMKKPSGEQAPLDTKSYPTGQAPLNISSTQDYSKKPMLKVDEKEEFKEGIKEGARFSAPNILKTRREAGRKVESAFAREDKIAPYEKGKSPQESEDVIKSRPIGLYRKIAFSFIFLTIILLAVIFYFSFTKVSIALIPSQKAINNNLILDIYDKDDGITNNNTALAGIVKEVEVEITEDYPASGIEVIGEETVGKVTIVNNYIKNQPLVATTRLLSPDNKLFRLKNTVNVPAGGKIEVEIYADKSGSDMALEPTTFTIPGLWAGLQDKIFAKNSETFVHRQDVKKYIVQSDIDNGIRDLKQQLLIKSKADINETYKEYDQIIYIVDDNSVSSNVLGTVGEEIEKCSITIEADVVVVAFKDQLAAELAEQKFSSSLPADKELVEFDKMDIIYSLDSYDIERGTASVNATFEGRVSLKDYTDVVEVDKILGLNKEQLEAYLSGIPDIAGFEITFSPSFIKKVPNLVDRVEIEIRK